MKSLLALLRATKVAIDCYIENERQSSCRHSWEPGRTSHGPVRHCKTCNLTEQLTDAMYYAHFGKMPHKWY